MRRGRRPRRPISAAVPRCHPACRGGCPHPPRMTVPPAPPGDFCISGRSECILRHPSPLRGKDCYTAIMSDRAGEGTARNREKRMDGRYEEAHSVTDTGFADGGDPASHQRMGGRGGHRCGGACHKRGGAGGDAGACGHRGIRGHRGTCAAHRNGGHRRRGGYRPDTGVRNGDGDGGAGAGHGCGHEHSRGGERQVP